LSVLRVIPFGSVWTILIGLFLLQNANLAAQSVQAQERLEGIVAEDVMIEKSPIAPDNLNLREFVNEYVIGQKEWKRFLLKDTTGKLSGILTVEALKTIPTSTWSQTPITQLKEPLTESLITVSAQTPLVQLLQLMEQKTATEIIVLSETQEMMGLVDRISIGQYLQKRSALPST
jgi:CBS-domain-containing membrane protein